MPPDPHRNLAPLALGHYASVRFFPGSAPESYLNSPETCENTLFFARILNMQLRRDPLRETQLPASDYDAAWECLDSIYGDARFFSDTITQDIVKFKAPQQEEDDRFCDLVHLVKRCYNTLKEVGIPSDMDNSHAILLSKKCVLVPRSGTRR